MDEKPVLDHINRHGYAFQAAVISRLKNLSGNHDFKWRFVTSEFPVQVNGHSTHIDFILKHEDGPFYLIGECKKVNPVKSWAFMGTNVRPEPVLREALNKDRGSWAARVDLQNRSECFNVGFAVKNKESNSDGGQDNALDTAIEQVTKGVNGLIEFIREYNYNALLGHNRGKEEMRDHIAFFPLIVTNAKCFTAKYKMGDVDLENAKLSDAKMEEVQSLFFTYNQSVALKHRVPLLLYPEDLRTINDVFYKRAAAIVRSTALEEFLTGWYVDDWKVNWPKNTL